MRIATAARRTVVVATAAAPRTRLAAAAATTTAASRTLTIAAAAAAAHPKPSPPTPGSHDGAAGSAVTAASRADVPRLAMSQAAADITIRHLRTLLADETMLYVLLRNCHWAVEGIGFHALHLLLETQYRFADAVSGSGSPRRKHVPPPQSH